VARTLQLAEELGGKSVMLPGESVVDSVLAYAHQHNITRSSSEAAAQPRARMAAPLPADRLLRECGPIDVYVINSEPVRGNPPAVRLVAGTQPLDVLPVERGLVALATLIGWPFHTVIAPANLVMLYWPPSWWRQSTWPRPSILASVLSVLVFDFFLIEPRLTLAVNDTEYLITFWDCWSSAW